MPIIIVVESISNPGMPEPPVTVVVGVMLELLELSGYAVGVGVGSGRTGS